MYTGVMDHPRELTTYGKLFFTLVVKTTHVRLDSLTIKSYYTTCVIYLHMCSKWDSRESTENRKR